MLPIKFRFIWQSGFRGEYLKKSTNQKQELLLVAMFVYGSGRNWQSSQRTCHSFGSFGQTVSEEKNLKNHPIRNKNRLWRPCLLMDWEKNSIIYRGPHIDDTYQVSVHLAKRVRGEDFLEINLSETRIVCGGHVC
jgi:hypothetical protein